MAATALRVAVVRPGAMVLSGGLGEMRNALLVECADGIVFDLIVTRPGSEPGRMDR